MHGGGGFSRTRARVFISHQPRPADPRPDIFDSYRPPFDLDSDMLFVASSTRTHELRSHFPRIRFLSLAGNTPLILWFSRVRSLRFGPAGDRRTLDEAAGFGYNELNVVALTRGRRLFVPAIYASGGLTQLLGHRYGMPKKPAEMSFAVDEGQVSSVVQFPSARSEAHASLLASGRLLSRPFDWSAPWWSWPADFPDGSYIRACIQRVPRSQVARVRGRLDLVEPWYPEATPLWPVGIYVPGLRMRLPAPTGV
jgi:hypothetical protein